MAELRGRGRIRSGAMSVDKAELCGSLLTWVGRGRGQGQVCARSSCPGALALAKSIPLFLGLGGGKGGGLAGRLDFGLSTRPRHVGGLRGRTGEAPPLRGWVTQGEGAGELTWSRGACRGQVTRGSALPWSRGAC